MAEPITREERAALIERAQVHLDASEQSRFSHLNGYEIFHALVASEAEVERLRKALTPSAETKAAYIGEQTFTHTWTDEDGEDHELRMTVPWTTVKEIMAMISARAALTGEKK